MLERGLEILVSIEYLPAFRSPTGTAAFGVLCEMVGKCIQHVALGRYSSALLVASRIGRPILDGIKDPAQREAFEKTYEAFVGTLECLVAPGTSTVH